MKISLSLNTPPIDVFQKRQDVRSKIPPLKIIGIRVPLKLFSPDILQYILQN